MMSMIIFYVFLAAESDIRFASSCLDLAVPELWIFAFLLKSEKKISSVSDLQLQIGCFSMYFCTIQDLFLPYTWDWLTIDLIWLMSRLTWMPVPRLVFSPGFIIHMLLPYLGYLIKSGCVYGFLYTSRNFRNSRSFSPSLI